MHRILATLLLLLVTTVANAQDLTEACEMQLALSALPERLRADATALVWRDGSYHPAQTGSGAFSCIVERNHPLALIPQCMDRAGADTILPALVWKSERVMRGDDPDQVRQQFAEQLAAGAFSAPERPGVSYMISAYNRIHLAARGDRIPVGPHVMYYAPGLSNEDIGGAPPQEAHIKGLPFVLDQGPHGYMISFVEKTSDSQAVQAACGDQLAAFAIEG